MTAHIIDGRHYAQQITDTLKQDIADKNISPCLAVILVGDDPASKIYVEYKKKACAHVGIDGQIHAHGADTNQDDIINLIHNLNNDDKIHGILLQLPLPNHLNAQKIIQSIDPQKDVDGLTHINMGRVMSGEPYMTPCTPQGVLELLKEICDDLSGKHAVIVGRSLLFGKPMGQILLHENCTVTQAHSRTQNLPDITTQADILIVATGQEHMISASHIKKGAIIIDVGISRGESGKLNGDVNFKNVKNIASAITPVPGGVGPMTIACLLRNTVKAALSQRE